MATLEELRKLPPAERVKKLKEFAEEKKKEAVQAESLIKQSDEEIKLRQVEERIPVPELPTEPVEEESLEETVAKEEPESVSVPEYGAAALANRPVEYFAALFEEAHRKITEVGAVYLLPKEEQFRLEYAAKGWERKLEDIESGRYTPPEETLEAITTVTNRLKYMSSGTQVFRKLHGFDTETAYK